ncbi:hypothetical protein JCM3770_005872 [Rhodotorula araucariae]
MLSSQDQETLKLLRALPPLLSPDLPSLPPSALAPEAGPLKRKREDSGDAPNRTVGLGLEGTEPTEQPAASGGSSKRPRPSAPPPPPPPPPSAPSSARGPPPPPPPTTAPPDLRGSPALSAAKLPPAPAKGSPLLGGAAAPPRAEREAEWRREWPKERLRRLAVQCRDHGRKLKHSGDALGRVPSPSRKDVLRALAHHVDSILLYVFSFWCDDAASRACNVQQWASMFGLIAFVRKMAERENVAVVVGLCTRMEAIAVYTTCMHEQKMLNYTGAQLSKPHPTAGSAPRPPGPPPPLPPGPPPPPPPPPPDASAGSPSSVTTDSPAATASPAPAIAALPLAAGGSTKAYDDFLRSFLRASPDLFRHQRLYDDSCALLSPALLATSFPRTWALCTTPAAQAPIGAFVLPARPWRFAWPAELGRGTLGHQVAWARALLEEWSEGEGLGYMPEDVGEGV